MVIGYGKIGLILHDVHSLKAKRKIVKAVVNQVRNNFNASVAETGDNDMHGRAEIGFALVGNSRQLVNSKMDRIVNMVEDMGITQVADSEMEIMNL
ncbi:MAG: DUF503 domain-containing protein [Desulfatibacillaceae bacterium]